MYNIGQWKQTWSCSMGLSEHDAIQSQRCTLSFNHCVWRDAFEWHYLSTSPTKDAPKRALKRWLSLPIEKQKNATKRTVKFRSWDGNLDRWIHKLRGRRDWYSHWVWMATTMNAVACWWCSSYIESTLPSLDAMTQYCSLLLQSTLWRLRAQILKGIKMCPKQLLLTCLIYTI